MATAISGGEVSADTPGLCGSGVVGVGVGVGVCLRACACYYEYVFACAFMRADKTIARYADASNRTSSYAGCLQGTEGPGGGETDIVRMEGEEGTTTGMGGTTTI